MVELQDDVISQKLIERKILQEDALQQAMQAAAGSNIPLHQYLIERKTVSKTQMYEILGEIYDVPYVDLPNFQISPDAIKAIPQKLAHRYKIIPIFKVGDTVNVAMANPEDITAVDHIGRKSKCEIDVCLAAAEDIENALREHYGSANTMTQLLDSLQEERVKARRRTTDKKKPFMQIMPATENLDSDQGSRPVIQLVSLMLKRAYEEGASDIHVEPEEKLLRIRYRVDGVLHEVSTPPKHLQSEIISRIKVLAEMDIAETRTPQDGRLKMDIQDKQIDMRVSSIPTVYGENVVIRILKDTQSVMDLASLGMDEPMQDVFETLIMRPFGMILETGPTGSGKTTTLYAALNMINSVERNIITIEDPVEYKLPMIRQIAVNNKAGLSFAAALRSILRQDPDVIMVGEIRDAETAEIAIQAALTGHLVFSTLHTNNAAGVVTRLVDMKVEPYLVASSVAGVISQRLVRKICENCKTEDRNSNAIIDNLKKLVGEDFPSYRGMGCRHCHHTGFKGRVAIFEILKIDDEMQKHITQGASSIQIEELARKAGLRSIREDALQKVKLGMTTIDEAMKAVDMGSMR